MRARGVPISVHGGVWGRGLFFLSDLKKNKSVLGGGEFSGCGRLWVVAEGSLSCSVKKKKYRFDFPSRNLTPSLYSLAMLVSILYSIVFSCYSLLLFFFFLVAVFIFFIFKIFRLYTLLSSPSSMSAFCAGVEVYFALSKLAASICFYYSLWQVMTVFLTSKLSA